VAWHRDGSVVVDLVGLAKGQWHPGAGDPACGRLPAGCM